jgi:hypothetical protein
VRASDPLATIHYPLATHVVEALVVFWFIVTPVASFYIRIPADKSLLTFDRIVLGAACLLLLLQRAGTNNRRFRLTTFEAAWAALSVMALSSALFRADDFNPAIRLALDSFWLPLVAFHLARHHLRMESCYPVLLAGAMALSVFLFLTGALEFVTGGDLFQYKGAELVRARERRVNGPFAADSSYAIICLLLLVFLIEAPRALRIKLDASARLARIASMAAAFGGSLLPLFRAVALAMAACWFVSHLALRKAVKHKAAKCNGSEQEALARDANTQPHRLSQRPGNLFAGLVLLPPLVVLGLASAGFLDLSWLSSRLSNPRNVVGRLVTWNAAIEIVGANPLFGVGLTNYRSYFETHHDLETDLVARELDVKPVNSPHSSFLWVAAELGLPALLVYLVAIFSLTSESWRALNRDRFENRSAAICLIMLIVAYVIPGLALTSGSYSDLNLCFFFLAGLLAGRFSVEEKTEGNSRQS